MKLSEIDLNLLLTLGVVLEERSVTRAARRLHVTAPAISNSLARLRAVLGDPLVVRSGRGIAPTPRALELLPRLRAALAELEALVELGRRFEPLSSARTFTLVCTDSEQLSLVPQFARLFAAKLPRSTLVVASVDQLEALGGIERAEVDAVITPLPRGASSPFALPLYDDDAVLVARRRHRKIRGRLTRALFNELRHVDVRVALGARGIGNRAAEQFFEQHGLSRKIAVAVPTFSAAVLIAATTELVAGVPRRLARTFSARVPLQIVELPTPPLIFSMSVVWQERTDRDAGSRYFRELLIEAARGVGGARRRG